MKRKKIMAVFGTRPEAVKMCPLVRELKGRDSADICVCVTGQHREMLWEVMRELDVSAERDLGVMKSSQTLFDVTSGVLEGMKEVLTSESPDVVLVHGDTATAFAVSLACFYLGIPTAHVEAGLRTGDIRSPFPEEFNRRAIALTASYHFAPTTAAAENLLRESVPPSCVFVTGNTVVDTVRYTLRESYTHPLLEGTEGKRIVFLTAHRRESLGAPLEQMLSAVRQVAETYDDVLVIYPVHPNPCVATVAETILGDCPRVRLCSPLGVIDCHNIMARSYILVTDSGGLQEEGAALRKPVLIMRNVTERPEGLAAGVARLVGTETESVFRSVSSLLENGALYSQMSLAPNPYGDGNASARIADILEERLL